jgi:hypothetical protein
MENLNLLKALLVFVASGMGDILWTFYILRTSEKRAHPAGLFSALIILTGGLVVITYTGNPWYLIPAALGAYVGTVLAVKYDSYRARKNGTKIQ